jgi:hypothetical protein
MKRQALSLISLLGLLLVAGSAVAQTTKLRANVPFNFTVNNKSLAAGTYEIRRGSVGDSGVLIIRGPQGSILVSTNARERVRGADKTMLVFHRYGTQNFLSEIWVAGAVRGRQLPIGNREKELARNLTPQPVEILASLP